jgi:hypothetical protein
MKALPILAALVALVASGAGAVPFPGSFPVAPPQPQPGMHGFHHFHNGGGLLIIEAPPVIVEREVVREVPVEQHAPPPPPPPRPAYVLGRTYASLPGGCMKMIERGATYYQCSGEWYRRVPSGYRAVARP